MKRFDRIIQWFAGLIWGYRQIFDKHTKTFHREPKAHFHSQNLNEDRQGKVKGWPYHGRCWLETPHENIQFSWNLWTHFCGFSFGFDPEEDGWRWHIAFPPFSFWLSSSGPKWFREWWRESQMLKRWNNKYDGYKNSHSYTFFDFFDISIHDKGLFWSFLKFDWGWSNKMPKWMSGSFYPLDFLFGPHKYSKEILKTVEAGIPMPEGSYPAKIEMELCTWKRPRWPFSTKGLYANVKIPWGIPHQGKGENPWDCGEDRLYGGSCRAATPEEAISHMVESALKSRRKYDGNLMAKYPPPSAPPPRAPEGSPAEMGA